MPILGGTSLEDAPTPWILWFLVVVLILVAILVMFLSSIWNMV
jgi:hypothetical protein